ncbi:MAG: hypothetical protein V3S29_10415, partial [bacterium]
PGAFTGPSHGDEEELPGEFFWKEQNALAIAEDASHCSEFSRFLSAATGDRAGVRRQRRICDLYDKIYELLKKHGATK